MTRNHWVGSLLIAGAGLMVPSPVLASLFEPVRDQQLVCEATDIVRGRLIDVHSAWDLEGRSIWTTATLQIDAVHRGRLSPGAAVTVKEAGGTAGGLTLWAEGVPTLEEGEEVVVLLRPWDEDPGTYRIWGYARGKFTIARRDRGGPTVTRADIAPRSGQPTMLIDQLMPTSVLENLERQLGSLAGACRAGRNP